MITKADIKCQLLVLNDILGTDLKLHKDLQGYSLYASFNGSACDFTAGTRVFTKRELYCYLWGAINGARFKECAKIRAKQIAQFKNQKK